MPTLRLWKRLMRVGALQLLKRDKAGVVTTDGLLTFDEVWWTGDRLAAVARLLRDELGVVVMTLRQLLASLT